MPGNCSQVKCCTGKCCQGETYVRETGVREIGVQERLMSSKVVSVDGETSVRNTGVRNTGHWCQRHIDVRDILMSGRQMYGNEIKMDKVAKSGLPPSFRVSYDSMCQKYLYWFL